LQKPEGLTAFGRADELNNIYISIKFLTLIFSGQFIPANYGIDRCQFTVNILTE
jgi:hypothetical protein